MNDKNSEEEEKSSSTKATTTKFFKEIISITIGLSIALAIENYSIDYKHQKLEHYYLTEIKNDLASDIGKLEEIINYNKVRSSNLNQLTYGELPADSFLLCTSFIRTVSLDFKASNPNFEAMKSSGYFNIVKNKDLLNKIIEHYDYYKPFETQKHDLDEHFTQSVIPYLENNFVLWDFFILDTQGFKPKTDIKKVSKDHKFRNLIITQMEGLFLRTNLHQGYLALNNELIKEIEKELAK